MLILYDLIYILVYNIREWNSPFINHTAYLGATIAVAVHEMRILNRYGLGPFTSFFSPLVSLLPIIPISHASATYSRLTLSSLTYSFEPVLGYLVVIGILVCTIVLIKKDDRCLLQLIGKNEKKDAFETVGVPKWLRKRIGV